MSDADDRALEARAKARGLSVWQLRAAEAVGDDLIADIVRDNRRPTHSLPSHSSVAAPEKSAEPQRPRGTGWVEPAPLRANSDPHFDKMMDAQDAIDRSWSAS
jgi:hypothetical protein